jgi:hypothetical protein
MIPELPRLSSRYTNQKFGAYSDDAHSHKYMTSKVNTPSITTSGRSNRTSRRSKRNVPY